MGAGICDSTISNDRSTLFEFIRFLGRPVWTAKPTDADRYLAAQRKLGRAYSTVQKKAWGVGEFFDFLILRHQGDISALTGYVIEQVIDEFNRPAHADYGAAPVPPSEDDVENLFSQWGQWLPSARKFLPAARDYMAASLWRRAGLRINETRMLDIRDWRRDLGEYGSLHVRFGKSSRGRGPKTRLVSAINSVGVLLDWWMVDVRHQFGDDYDLMDAPLLPAERSLDAVTGLSGPLATLPGTSRIRLPSAPTVSLRRNGGGGLSPPLESTAPHGAPRPGSKPCSGMSKESSRTRTKSATPASWKPNSNGFACTTTLFGFTEAWGM